MEKAHAAGFTEDDFEGEGKINAKMVNEKVKPKQSAYFAQYFTGDNEEVANLIGKFLTQNHSEKIKAGNRLEDDVADDIKENSTHTFHKAKSITDPDVQAPCVIASCRFTREQYESNGLKCKNKKEVEIDLVIMNTTSVDIVELKNGCDFDTKKSKGEVQSLEETKNLCEKLEFKNVNCSMCCFDAMEKSDMKLKTTMGKVNTMVYSELAEKCGLNGDESRQRINQKIQSRAYDNLKNIEDFIKAYQALKN